jgi:hypothetical protein
MSYEVPQLVLSMRTDNIAIYNIQWPYSCKTVARETGKAAWFLEQVSEKQVLGNQEGKQSTLWLEWERTIALE